MGPEGTQTSETQKELCMNSDNRHRWYHKNNHDNAAWQPSARLQTHKDRSERPSRQLVAVAVLHGVNVLLDFVHINVGDGAIAVKDTCNVFECGALGLDVEKPNENKLAEIPQCVKKHKMPVLWHAFPCDLVGLAAGGQHTYGAG